VCETFSLSLPVKPYTSFHGSHFTSTRKPSWSLPKTAHSAFLWIPGVPCPSLPSHMVLLTQDLTPVCMLSLEERGAPSSIPVVSRKPFTAPPRPAVKEGVTGSRNHSAIRESWKLSPPMC
jgi:hypothetical protein